MTYQCSTSTRYSATGYMLEGGDQTAECVEDEVDPSSGYWKYSRGETPRCIPANYCVDPPPEIVGGELVTYNSSAYLGQAEYRCSKGRKLYGDGIARCLFANGYDGVLKGRFDLYSWMYQPSCPEFCQPPAVAVGDVSNTVLTVTKCTETTTKKWTTDEENVCDQPVVYQLSKTEEAEVRYLPVFAYTFRGGDACFAEKATKKKYETSHSRYVNSPGTPSEECATLCVKGCGGFGEMVADEKLIFKEYYNQALKLTKVVYKFQTRCE